jgi:hypothetical protein
MKLIKILSKVFVVTAFVLLPSFCFAQFSISEVIGKMPTTSVPFNATKKTGFLDGHSYWVVNPNNAIPDKLYDNLQLTEYTSASVDPELGAGSFRKFSVPNSTNTLLIVSFGGATDWRTDVACVVSPSGQVLSTLEVAVCVADVWVKQFRINAETNITVTSIIPTSTASIPFGTFTRFEGRRTDASYSINTAGQFVSSGFKPLYNSKTYTRSYLEGTSELWEGTETYVGNGKTTDLPVRPLR